MNIDIKRFKNYGLWVAIFSLIPMILSSLGIKIIPEDYEKITTTILTIFATLGILNNPTTECKWYQDENKNENENENENENGNRIIKEEDSKKEVTSEKANYERDTNERLYSLIGELIKDKVSNTSKIDNIEALLKQNLESLYNSRNVNEESLNYKNQTNDNSSYLIKRNIEELLRDNAKRLVKENLEKFLNDNIKSILENNMDELIKKEEDELIKK